MTGSSKFTWSGIWPWLLVVGGSALSGHYCMSIECPVHVPCMSRAFALAPATVVMPMDFLRLPLIAIVGFLVYHEPLDIFVFAGVVIMLAGNMVNVRARHRTETCPVTGRNP